MRLHLLAVGGKMRSWVAEGYADYAGRLPRHLAPRLVELPLARRTPKSDPAQARKQEAERLQAALPAGARVVALHGAGKPWSTESLATHLANWMQSGTDVALVIGGPDGIDPEFLGRCHQRWSLGPMTLPHPLVRVVVAEQLYRAWSILGNHPYHRGG